MRPGSGVNNDSGAADAAEFTLISRLWLLAVLTAPWSVEVPLAATGWRLAVPQEPLLVFILAMVIRNRRSLDVSGLARSMSHPVVVVAAASLVWTAVCAATSTVPVVAAKALVVRGLQATVYLLLGLVIVRRRADARRVAVVGAVGLAPIAVWALVRAQVLDGSHAVHASAMPFFHSRLELTVAAAFWLLAVAGWEGHRWRWWLRGVKLLLLGAVVGLRGRSAVVGLVIGIGGRVLARLRCRPEAVMSVVLLIVVGAAAVVVDGWVWRETEGDRFRPTTVLEPVWSAVSATELAHDESVLERFNRWRCATLMAVDRPLTGFGPGTFEREYGVYQRDRDRTVWSTDRGDLGDAHSDYLGRLAEEGAVGLALHVLLVGVMLWTGFRVAAWCRESEVRRSAEAWTGAVAGLAAAGAFVCLSDLPGTGLALWVAAAVLVRLDLEVRPKRSEDA